MFKYLFIVIAVIFGVLFWVYFGIGPQGIYKENTVLSAKSFHVFGEPGIKLDSIEVKVVYFVPKNRTDFVNADWTRVLAESFQKLSAFHSLQFEGRMPVSFDVYPRPVIGLKTNLEYDSEITREGNPSALISSSEEIYLRIFTENGDLYEKKFAEHKKGAYPVLFVMYEGIGAVGGIIRETGGSERPDVFFAGNERGESIFFDVGMGKFGGFFLLNREYLFGVHGDFGTTFFVHEFYHTLGIPNAYYSPENNPFISVSESEDIMGLGRFRPIESVFLDKNTLKQMQY